MKTAIQVRCSWPRSWFCRPCGRPAPQAPPADNKKADEKPVVVPFELLKSPAHGRLRREAIRN